MSVRDLERILQGAPSRSAWRRLIVSVAAAPAVDLDAIAKVLDDDWPDDLREAPADAWRAARGGAPPPWWSLVRRVALTNDDEPDAAALAALAGATELALAGENAAWLPKLAALPALAVLDLGALAGFETCEMLPVLPALHTLTAYDCEALVSLAGLERLPALEVLGLSRCASLELATLPALPDVLELSLDDTPIRDLAPLARAPALADLAIAGCAAIDDLAPLAACASLERLDARRVRAVRSLAPLDALRALHTLWLEGDAIGDLAPVAELPIEELIVGHASTVDVASIRRLAALDTLHLVDLQQVALDALAGSALAHLFVLRCARVSGLDALATLADATQLVLEALPDLRALTAVGAMPALRELQISACDALDDLSGLATASSLRLVAIRACPRVRDVSPLAGLPNLQHIDLSDTPIVRGLELIAPLLAR